ncbi:M23 family metallopeptidase [Winogradskyella sp. PG-2]|uniref:M23 family metallopeptidase n=1 Tax=Winogradskyella sp. PG-2 TaxID=754409 RepID=UPI000458923D|nr:M23 family metallopeptidase [Winogradskyella sp. PG-2]BAO77391.1 membrane proteins related to metalloendopeptidases [Winogradskyella sp. PG-2]
MKLVTVLLVMVFMSFKGFSQENNLEDSLRITIEEPIINLKKGTVTNEVAIPIISPLESNEDIDIKSEFWETSIYNPYQNTFTEFPFKITFSDSLYTSPVSHKKVITSRYGWRRGRPHQGIDIDLVTGDSVVSILDGIVRFARYSRGHGKTVVVRHFNGLETTYAHLSYIAVKPNDTISKGGYLGKGGNTGNSRGSHLHLVVSYQGEYIHPEYLFDFSETNKIRAKELWVTRQWTHAQLHSSRRVSKVNLLTTKEAALLSLKKQKKVYVVKKGDTLYGISRRNNLSISKICNTNAIKISTPLKIGQKLVLEL